MELLCKCQYDVNGLISKARINFKKSPKERLTEPYIEARLENLEKHWESFTETHAKIVPKTDYEKSEYYENDLYEITEEIYFEYKAELKECLSHVIKIPRNLPVENATTTHMKLPKIEIPMFSGNYLDWCSFRDLFLSLIHANKTLDDVQKLHYLKTHLTGEAEQLLKHIPITADNYSVCWQQLTNRYNNVKYLANCILKRFLSQKNILSENSKCIKELLDTSNECLNALKNLKINTDSWDIIVIHILCLKLDNESRKLWESKISDITELPTYKQFKEFLEQRFRSLEFLDNKKEPVKDVQRNTSVKTLHVANVDVCEFCNDNHKIARCKIFCKESTQARRDFVRDKRLCYNCLGSHHSVKACRQPISCRICHRRHHSLLHYYSPLKTFGQSQEDQSVNNVVATSKATSKQNEDVNFVSNCTQSTSSLELLPTALVKAESKNSSAVTLRVLLDQGSQASYITESSVQFLGLKKVASKSFAVRLGEDEPSLVSNHTVTVELSSWHDSSFRISIKAHVLKKLTTFLPKRRFTISRL